MIAHPVNDRTCLDAITEVVIELVERGDVVLQDLATRYPTTDALIAWIRALPQRDDEGTPGDGPKVDACNPPQRLRIPADDPNCVERAALYVGVAELINPTPVRQLATVDTPTGPHTFPVENDRPVVLDPKVSRNALAGGLYRNAPSPVRITPGEALDWIADLAEDAARAIRGGRRRVARAHAAMQAVLEGVPLQDDVVEDVALVLALAEREARAFGPTGVTVVLTAAETLAELDAEAHRNTRGWRVAGWRVRPHPTTEAVARAGGRIGARAAAAARAYLATLGVPPTLLDELELELRREGLTLGALGRPPAPGSEALAAAAARAPGD